MAQRPSQQKMGHPMKKILSILFIILLIATTTVQSSTQHIRTLDFTSSDINVLFIVPQNYGANTFFNMDNLDLLGFTYTITGTDETLTPCSWSQANFGLPDIHPDILIKDITDLSDYDVVFITSSTQWVANPYGDLLNSQETLELLSDAAGQDLIIWATCAGVRVLAAADILSGVKIQGKSAYLSEYQAADALWQGEQLPPVIDNNIVTTSRGQYWNYQNIQAIATALELQQSTTLQSKLQTTTSPQQKQTALFTTTYGGTAADAGRALLQTTDKGYVIAGYTYSSGLGNADLYLIKTDSFGNEEWSTTTGGAGFDYGHCLCLANDEGYLVAGYSSSQGNGQKDILLLKVNNQGEEQWINTYGGTAPDVAMSIQPTEDGYLILGYTESYGSGEDDIYLLKIDNQGNLLWDTTYGGEHFELGYHIIPTQDGNYAIAGATGSNLPNTDCILLKISPQGDLLWQQTYGGGGGDGGYDRAHSLIQTENGGYLIVGETNAGDALNMFLIGTDNEGNKLFSKTITNSGSRLHDHAYKIIATNDGNYAICGTFKDAEATNNIGLIKISETGTELWKTILPMSGIDWASDLIQTIDGAYALTGHTTSIGHGSHDAILITLDSNGNPNQAPDTPHSPQGETGGKINTEYTYTTTTTDPEENDIYYLFDWGDGTDSGWIGPINSGQEARARHQWTEKGDYSIIVKARDSNGMESEWSAPLPITMPVQQSHNTLFQIILQFIHQIFTTLFST